MAKPIKQKLQANETALVARATRLQCRAYEAHKMATTLQDDADEAWDKAVIARCAYMAWDREHNVE